MRNLKTFESFILPKPFRKLAWKDEKLALVILDKLKSTDVNDIESLQKLNITTELKNHRMTSVYNFFLGLPYTLAYNSMLDEYYVSQGNYSLEVSKEVSKQIEKELIRLKS